VLSITLFAYYLFWNQPRLFFVPWHAEPWFRAIIILPPVCGAIWLGLHKGHKDKKLCEPL
jgi:hypothetical protein